MEDAIEQCPSKVFHPPINIVDSSVEDLELRIDINSKNVVEVFE